MNVRENILAGQEGAMETYFTTKGLSEYLKIPEQSIRRWVMNNEIPYRRIHNVIRYRLSEIELWVGENKNKFPAGVAGGIADGFFDETEGGEIEQATEAADCGVETT